MSFTALLWLASYCAAAVGSFVNPLFGTLGYLLEYYQRPELRWWGKELPALRWNLMMSVVLGLSFLIRRGSLRELVPTRNLALRWLLTLAVIMILVTATVAVDTDRSYEWMVQWMKMAIVYPLLIIATVRTRRAFDAFAVTHMLGAFTWGWQAWMDPKRAQGRLMAVGSGDTYNDNEASSHLLTVLPLTLVYMFTAKGLALRAVGLVAAPFVMNTLILCNSRGAMVGLAAATLAAVYMVGSGKRIRLVVAAAAIALGGLSLTDQTFIDRQNSTADYEQDASANERLMSWKGGFQLAKDHPLGVGGRGFHILSPIYIPEVVAAHGGDPRAPHNTYVMAISEWGVLGLLSFVSIYISAFIMLWRVKKSALPSEEGFYYWRAFAIQLALVALLVASCFVDRVYGEAGYWMVALSYCLYRLQRTEQAAASSTSEPVVEELPMVHARNVNWPMVGAGYR
jgi:putative inorganic carbon (hco3(-)) transporter